MRIGIVSGEASGDILGAGLIQAIRQHYPDCQFAGVGGEQMQQQGFESLFSQDRLAVMGFVEPLKRLPELLNIRKKLYQYFVEQKFNLVIGIDSPDFNLHLEKKCRESGIKTIHYVSPSVWAWRQGRIKLIKQAVDAMLTLLPFEAEFYKKHQVPVTFVGHPLADKFPLKNDIQQARASLKEVCPQLNIAGDNTIIACLPGSREVEIKHIGSTLWQSMRLFCKTHKNVEIIIPALNLQRKRQIEFQLQLYNDLPATVVEGNSQQIMAVADAVVMASGTTTLEAMLLKKPMVVVYKKDALSYALISRMLKVKHISLPNLLAGKALVPELLQSAATPEAISRALAGWIDSPERSESLIMEFEKLHQQLNRSASETAANVVVNLLESTKSGDASVC